jgi:hypothetical protein
VPGSKRLTKLSLFWLHAIQMFVPSNAIPLGLELNPLVDVTVAEIGLT